MSAESVPTYESPLRGEKPDFWHVSKFNIGSLPLCGILPGNIVIIILICSVRFLLHVFSNFEKRFTTIIRTSSVYGNYTIRTHARYTHHLKQMSRLTINFNLTYYS